MTKPRPSGDVDVAVIGAANRGHFDPDEDFEVTPPRVWLSESGRKKRIGVYERRKHEEHRHPALGDSLSWVRMMELEVRLLEKEWSGDPGLFARLRLHCRQRSTMPEPRHWYLVMYDISAPPPCARCMRHETLTAWGHPAQYSVFRVQATKRQIHQLHHELVKIVDSDDRLLLIRVCDSCLATALFEGRDLEAFDLEPPPFKVL